MMLEHRTNGVPWLSFPGLDRTGLVTDAFSTREGGVSTGHCATLNFAGTVNDSPEAIAENYRRMASALSVELSCMVTTHQTHTTNVRRVGRDDAGKGLTRPRPWTDVDGLITDVPGLMLVAFFADCVPLYFLDPVHRAIGLSHSGWKGSVNRMGAVTVRKMMEAFGTDPADLLAGIGPCICRSCYEVDERVAREVRAHFTEEERNRFLVPGREGHYQMDLPAMNRHILREAGIPDGQIEDSGLCTCCESDRFFSHRATGGKRGNHCAFLMLKA